MKNNTEIYAELKGNKKSKILNVIIIIISAFLMLFILGFGGLMSVEYFSLNNDKEASLYSLNNEFQRKNYIEVYNKTSYIDAKHNLEDLDTETRDFVLFGRCFEAIIQYEKYTKLDKKEMANNQLKIIKDNESKITHRVFKDTLDDIKIKHQVS